ncbi:hypothetical protein JOF56_004589 [Kibdelosporangium banguiense]|uniref:Immunity protein 50 n=1 Tax=Kibdelosporangium banguiense TaxID=1365924 RepID=A0ABS4TJL1_9PSEU|nr:hypothetical protein [Kibdelosporangium banguiense]MBP2324204.1 hypothetical protein [Kibdelosporangium banguiense]
MTEPPWTLEFDRPFHFWFFYVSHAQLVLRSPRRGHEPRIDVIFTFTGEFNLPRTLDDLRIDALAPHDPRHKELGVQRLDFIGVERTAYAITASNFQNGLVTAHRVEIQETDREYDDIHPFEGDLPYMSFEEPYPAYDEGPLRSRFADPVI